MVTLVQQMANNFIETLENLQKSMGQLDANDIKQIAKLIHDRFKDEDSEVIDMAQIIVLALSGAEICFACGRPLHNGCICGPDAEPFSV